MLLVQTAGNLYDIQQAGITLRTGIGAETNCAKCFARVADNPKYVKFCEMHMFLSTEQGLQMLARNLWSSWELRRMAALIPGRRAHGDLAVAHQNSAQRLCTQLHMMAEKLEAAKELTARLGEHLGEENTSASSNLV